MSNRIYHKFFVWLFGKWIFSILWLNFRLCYYFIRAFLYNIWIIIMKNIDIFILTFISILRKDSFWCPKRTDSSWLFILIYVLIAIWRFNDMRIVIRAIIRDMFHRHVLQIIIKFIIYILMVFMGLFLMLGFIFKLCFKRFAWYFIIAWVFTIIIWLIRNSLFLLWFILSFQ